MIFERRVYTLRPGKVGAFWDAQSVWNTADVFGGILERNIAYFSTISGHDDQIVHLYRFDSLDDWRSRYDAYYRKQSPDYFKLVRPWMLKQENAFLVETPIPKLAAFGAPAGGDAAASIVVEQVIDLFPGGLARYWDAYRAHGGDVEKGAERSLGAMVSLVGPLHRVIHYHCFTSLADVQDDDAALQADARWRSFVAGYEGVVAASRTSLLRPSPLSSRRSFFEPTF